MNDHPQESSAPPTAGELAEYGLVASTGLGMLILALAPLAIPFLALTAVFVLPLLLPVLALGLIGVIVAAPILLVRRLGRRVRPKPETRTAPRGGAVRGSVAGRRATG